MSITLTDAIPPTIRLDRYNRRAGRYGTLPHQLDTYNYRRGRISRRPPP